MEVKVEEKDGHLQINWLLNKIAIPLSAITEVSSDDTYGGQEKEAIRIGFHPAIQTEWSLKQRKKLIYYLRVLAAYKKRS